jgi:hypothetical protein
MSSYTQYLGARRCCDLKVQGPQGPQGVPGPASVGPVGYQGYTGAQGYQGATGRGCAGPTGAQGAAGTTGPAGGAQGSTGSPGITGAQGFQGVTGSTGPQGVTGPSQWTPMNGLGITGGGYTGIGVTGQDVLIYGNLLVTGGIDPIYLALTPQASGPTGFTNPLWVDSVNGNALRSQNIYMDNPSINNAYISLKPDNTNQIILNDGGATALSNTINYSSMTLSDTLNTLTIDKSNITYSGATGPLGISSNESIDLSSNIINLTTNLDVNITSLNEDINLNADTTGSGFINMNAFGGVVINQIGVLTPPDYSKTTLNGYTIETFQDTTLLDGTINQMTLNPVELFIDNTNNTISTQQYGRFAPNAIEIYDHTNNGTNSSRIQVSSETFNYAVGGIVKPSFYQFQLAGNNIFRYNTTGIQMGSGGNGVNLNLNNIKYPTSYNTAQVSLSNTSNSVQTFNISVAPFGAILPIVSATNVGTQFIITNVNANNLGVSTSSSQSIYSSTGAPSSLSRVLAEGNSRIFTAIQTTGSSTYGWSMV